MTIDDFIITINQNKPLFDNMSCNDIIFWGCGNTSKLYQPCFEYEHIFPLYFTDSNSMFWNTKFINEIEVIEPATINERCQNPLVMIVSATIDARLAILKQCETMGVNAIAFDEYVFYKNQEQIIDNYSALCDDISKETYIAILMSRICNKKIDEKLVFENQYFCIREYTRKSASEVFVDCGAYVGDSVETYLWKKSGTFKRIYAFEPDIANFNAMVNRVERLKREWGLKENRIICVNAGIDDHIYSINMSSGESSLSSLMIDSESGVAVPVTTIDEYFKNEKVSFLKADIESYETKLLEGAQKVIKRDHPLLAICIYHNATDMYNIQRIIKQIDSSYSFSIRQHYGYECETVLYAY